MLPINVLNPVLKMLTILPLGTAPLMQTLLLQMQSLETQGQSQQQMLASLISAIASVTPLPLSADTK